MKLRKELQLELIVEISLNLRKKISNVNKHETSIRLLLCQRGGGAPIKFQLNGCLTILAFITYFFNRLVLTGLGFFGKCVFQELFQVKVEVLQVG